MKTTTTTPTIEDLLIEDLGEGLILRRATPADADSLSDFNARIHSDDGPDQPDEPVRIWTRDLLTKPHPTFEPGDFTVVEDSKSGKIVSSLNLISQTWTYAGIPVKVGRPELVGTLPDYRNRGLIRTQFELVHAWSAARGELIQGITGIPFYYRLFGYEMAVDLGGGRSGFTFNMPKLKDDEDEPYRLRPAVEDDLPFISRLYADAGERYLMYTQRDEALWRYELNGKSAQNVNRVEMCIIETPGGQPVGFIFHPPMLWFNGARMTLTAYELVPGVSYGAVTPSVIRYLWAVGKEIAAREKKKRELSSIGFWLRSGHPAFFAAKGSLPDAYDPYAWYLRVPDLPKLLQHIRPALEQRLAASPLSGHSAELEISFYRRGLRLAIEAGKLTKIEAWKPHPLGHSGNAAFPGLTFIQLLFGYRSLEELEKIFPDLWTEDEITFGLLNALFPKQQSDLWGVS